MLRVGCRPDGGRELVLRQSCEGKRTGADARPYTVDATTLLGNGKRLMLALATGVSGGGVARGLDFRRTGGAGSGFGGMGGILACRPVSGAVPIHIAHGDSRRCFRF